MTKKMPQTRLSHSIMSTTLDVDKPTTPPPSTTTSEAQPIDGELPFWNTNLPTTYHTPTCPTYLLYALSNPKDRAILATPDALYTRQTWSQVCSFVASNRLDLFQRVPSELRLYREFCEGLVERYGSVREFVMKERLGWGDLRARGKGFGDENDYKILHNDWPYGVDTRIVHLVVWTKFSLPSDPQGNLLPETREMIQEFVDGTFGRNEEAKKVIWFVNPASLKSIHSVEHFHVMLWDPDPEMVRRVTGGDVPWRTIVQKERRSVEEGE